MGVVYEVFDERRGESVALKTLRRISPEGIANVKREFRLVSELAHPNLVWFYDLFVTAEACFFTLELLQGMPISSYVHCPPTNRPIVPAAENETTSELPAFNPADFLRIDRVLASFAQLAGALSYLHDAGIIHRDLKPSNIVILEGGLLKLLDFGISQSLLTSGDGPAPIVGTPLYMSPEQARGERAGPASDLYSMGVLLYYLLTGRYPFEGKTVLHILNGHKRMTPIAPIQLAPHIPRGLNDLCVALLQKDPAQRPNARDAQSWLQQLGAPTPPRPHGPRPRFVGRGIEMEEIAATAARVSNGNPHALILWGESGAGKSALCQEAVKHLTNARWRALFARCYEREALPYNALDPLLDTVASTLSSRPGLGAPPPSFAALASMFPVLQSLLGDSPAPVTATGAERRRRAGEALRWLLREYARNRPLVLWIDDLQWADKESLNLLAQLFEPDCPSLLLLGTYRTSAIQRPYPLERLHGVQNITSRYMTPFGVDEILSLFEQPTPRPIAEQILRESHGNVFLAVQLAAAFSERNQPDLPVGTLLRERLIALPEASRHVLEVLALAGGSISFEVLSRSAGLSSPKLSAALDELRWERWLKTVDAGDEAEYTLYHERLRDLLVEMLAAEEVTAWHERLANSFSSLRSPERAARHFLKTHNPARALPALIDAARRATQQRTFAQAADLYREVLDLSEPGSVTWELHAESAHALERSGGRYAEAAEAYRAAAAEAPPHETIRLVLRAASLELRQGEVEAALDSYRRALAPLGDWQPLPNNPFAAMAETALRVSEIERQRRRPPIFPTPPLPPLRALSLSAQYQLGVHLGHFDLFRSSVASTRAMRAALASGSQPASADALALYALLVAMNRTRNQIEKGRAIFAQALALRSSQHDPAASLWIDCLEALLCQVAGLFSQSETLLTAALAQNQQTDALNAPELAVALSARLASAAAAGQPEPALQGCAAAVEDAIADGDQLLLRILLPALTKCHTLRGDLDRAQDAISLLAPNPDRRANYEASCAVNKAAVLLAAREISPSRAVLERFFAEPFRNATFIALEQQRRAKLLLSLCWLWEATHATTRAQRKDASTRGLEAALSLARADDPVVEGPGLRVAALFYELQGERRAAQETIERALVSLQATGEAHELAAALLVRYSLFGHATDRDEAQRILRAGGFTDPAEREGNSWAWH
jgi:tetratricopeptide (TPR) repeat protein